MRTTLTLDPDVAILVDEAMHRDHKSMKEVVNDALRAALGRGATSDRHRVTPHHAELAPGLDPTGFNRLADELEDELILASAWRQRA